MTTIASIDAIAAARAARDSGALADTAAVDATPARRSRLAVLGLALALVGCAFGVSSFAPREAQVRAAVPVSRALQHEIAAMSTGAGQPIVVSGDSAIARNRMIPLSALPTGRMSGFREIAAGTAGYGTALRCMTQAIYYEAANEPETGKRAVAQVVMNRLRHPAWPNSVCGVVYEGANARVCQFSFTCDGSLLRTPMARQWAESQRVAAEMLAGGIEPSVGVATNYHADYVVPRWAYTLGKITQIGRHIFYRLPGRIGGETAFRDKWTGLERIPDLDWGRLRTALAVREAPTEELAATVEDTLVPGLSVVLDVSDRHATADVGGRLDTRTEWRLSIPDPAQISSGYRDALNGQGAAPVSPPPAQAVQEAVRDAS